MITVKKVVEKKEITCPHCKAVLEYKNSDIHDVYCGNGFTCPNCGNDIVIESSCLDIDKPVYPDNFYNFEGGVEIYEDEISVWCDEIFEQLKNSTEKFDFFIKGTGNTIVFGYKTQDGEIVITVAKNYEEFSYFPNDI